MAQGMFIALAASVFSAQMVDLTPLHAVFRRAALGGQDDSTEDLIRRLGSRSIEERTRAENALRKRGPRAEAAVRQARGHPDPEIRARARNLYRDLAVRRVRLRLDVSKIVREGNSIYVPSQLRNGSDIPLVFVEVNFFYQSRISYRLDPAGGGRGRWSSLMWSHGCAEIHPFKAADFIVIPPGEERCIGRLWIPSGDKRPGEYLLQGRYSFRRPARLDPRYLPNDQVRALYAGAAEVEGISSPEVMITIGPRRMEK